MNANDRILRKIKIVKYGVDFTEVIEEFDLKTVLKKGAIDENEWGLILSAPKEVEEKSRKMDLNTIKHAIPNIVEDEHYSNGFSDGSNIDYKKEIIDDKIVT